MLADNNNARNVRDREKVVGKKWEERLDVAEWSERVHEATRLEKASQCARCVMTRDSLYR